MAILPESTIDISRGVTFQEQPSNTFYVDPISKHVVGMTDGYKAIKQTVEIILNVERFFWQIYTPNFGMRWKGLIGQKPNYVAAEMRRRMADAFSVDTRILGISQFSYTVEQDKLVANLTVNTVFGDVKQTVSTKES